MLLRHTGTSHCLVSSGVTPSPHWGSMYGVSEEIVDSCWTQSVTETRKVVFGGPKRVLSTSRISVEWVARLARHRIIAQIGPEFWRLLASVDDMRIRCTRDRGGTATMNS
jgi:hypothetical protein